MSNAYRDENSVPTIIGASTLDGKTIVRAQADPISHRFHVDDNTTGLDHGTVNASRDENDIPVWIAASSSDGQTPVEIYINPVTNKLLINSN